MRCYMIKHCTFEQKGSHEVTMRHKSQTVTTAKQGTAKRSRNVYTCQAWLVGIVHAAHHHGLYEANNAYSMMPTKEKGF